MAQPTYYEEGDTPRPTDTRLRKWTKILAARQNRGGGHTENNPRPRDPLRRIQLKLLNAIRGSATN